MGAEEDFFKIYSSIPLEERNNTLVVIKDTPISWVLAYQEIKNKTKLGQQILKILKDLEII
ncbi:MAG: hypothetical protein AABW47_04035 [Nanoarchaeota archaeon]